jgi:hypothetical protein
MPRTTKSGRKAKPAATKSTTRTKTPVKKPTSAHKSRSKAQRKGLLHHGKRIYRVTPKFLHGMVVGAFVGIIIVTQFGVKQNVDALTIATGKDCDNYSIINCGVTSSGDLQNKYGNQPYVRHVYQHFGISAANISAIGQTAVQGTVFRNGDVKVNGKVVATDALTAARQRVTSQDKQVTVDGSTFFTRHLSVSWSHDSAPAYVVMKDGIFQYAILAPCGNPITAAPVKPPATPPPATIASLGCVSLGYNNKGLAYTFIAKATAKNTTIKSYSFYLSDQKSPVVVKSSATKVSLAHTFAKYSTRYSVYVTVSSKNITTNKVPVCSQALTTPAVSECKLGIPVGSPECNQCDKTNDAGNNACVPKKVITAAKITTLPETGPGAVLFVLAVSLVCGTLFHKTHHHIKKRRSAKLRPHHASHGR